MIRSRRTYVRLLLATKEGAVLVATRRGLARLDPQANSAVDAIALEQSWGSLEAASTAAVWGRHGQHQVSRVDLKTGQVAQVAVPGIVWKVIAAGENTVWVGFFRERKTWVAEIDAATTVLRREFPIPDLELKLFPSRMSEGAAVTGDDLWICVDGRVRRVSSSK